jgi:hypothetical protein
VTSSNFSGAGEIRFVLCSQTSNTLKVHNTVGVDAPAHVVAAAVNIIVEDVDMSKKYQSSTQDDSINGHTQLAQWAAMLQSEA